MYLLAATNVGVFHPNSSFAEIAKIISEVK